MPEDIVGGSEIIYSPKSQHLIDRLKRLSRDYRNQIRGYEEESLGLLFSPLVYFKLRIIELLISNGMVEKDQVVVQVRNQFPEEFDCGFSLFLKAWNEVNRLCDEGAEN